MVRACRQGVMLGACCWVCAGACLQAGRDASCMLGACVVRACRQGVMPDPPAMRPRHLYGTAGPPLLKLGSCPGGGLVSHLKTYLVRE